MCLRKDENLSPKSRVAPDDDKVCCDFKQLHGHMHYSTSTPFHCHILIFQYALPRKFKAIPMRIQILFMIKKVKVP